jgi:hypothetical protein
MLHQIQQFVSETPLVGGNVALRTTILGRAPPAGKIVVLRTTIQKKSWLNREMLHKVQQSVSETL